MNLTQIVVQNSLLATIISSVLVALPQFLAALPWLYALEPKLFRKQSLGLLAGLGLIMILGFAIFLGIKSNSENLQLYGRIYASVLQVQLLLDLSLFGPRLLTVFWPKGGAVALATFRECCRQPMYWLIFHFGLLCTWVAVVLPYFTFGDDFKMMKQIGFDIVMLCGLLFGTLAASISISEEIEGRTAITVMSKPVSRWQFLIGKFVGVILACALMSAMLLVNLNFALLVNPEFDPINKDRAFDPMPEQAKAELLPLVQEWIPPGSTQVLATGAAMWVGECFAHSIGLLLVFGQVMVLVAIATALATRVSFVVNLVIVLFVYLLGHLAPVVVKQTDATTGMVSTAQGLINFLARTFGAVLPSLEHYTMGTAIIRENPLDLWQFTTYVLSVTGYSLIYTMMALIVGLLLFDDRDLA